MLRDIINIYSAMLEAVVSQAKLSVEELVGGGKEGVSSRRKSPFLVA